MALVAYIIDMQLQAAVAAPVELGRLEVDSVHEALHLHPDIAYKAVRLLVDGQLQLATRLRRAPARRAERVDGVAQLGRVLALPRVVVGAENLEEGLDVVLVVEQVAVAARALVPVSGGNRISGARLVPTYTRLLDGGKLDGGLSQIFSG